jgi:hypothetical protein
VPVPSGVVGFFRDARPANRGGGRGALSARGSTRREIPAAISNIRRTYNAVGGPVRAAHNASPSRRAPRQSWGMAGRAVRGTPTRRSARGVLEGELWRTETLRSSRPGHIPHVRDCATRAKGFRFRSVRPSSRGGRARAARAVAPAGCCTAGRTCQGARGRPGSLPAEPRAC